MLYFLFLPHAVHYNPRTYLLYNRIFIPLALLHPVYPPTLTSDNYQSVLCIYELDFCLFACLLVFCFYFVLIPHLRDIIWYISLPDLFNLA